MAIFSFILMVVRIIANLGIAIWILSFFLFGGKWQVGDFMSIKLHGFLWKSKRRYKEEETHGN
ncbi:hypothetical protein [Enterococcus sp. AZ189]|uniref:hypothetical protein n=1 Tax=Enterococcus sp. AZ189 TaxID=2774871 RepID=UPI003F2126B2